MADQEKKSFPKGKGKGKGRGKPSFKRESEDSFVIKDGSNDAHWYGTDDVLKLAGNLSFFKALGTSVIPEIYGPNYSYPYGTAIPGIMFIELMDAIAPQPKNSAAELNPINIAARQQYALIRKANSGAKNYEWVDLIIYEMARVSMNQLFAFVARAYGVASSYNMQNRYMPRAILKGMGFDADDFIANLASIRLWLNNFAKRVNTLALPHALTYFERKSWLYSSIYTDGNASKAQLYVLTPGRAEGGYQGAFLVYNPTLSSQGGGLERKALFASGDTFGDWSPVADAWLNILLSDDDCAIISGDILKAYGDSNLFKCNEIPEDFKISPVYNEEVLSQIENLTCAPAAEPTKLSQDTGDDIPLHEGAIMQAQTNGSNLLFDPIFNTNQTSTDVRDLYVNINPVLNYHHTDVTPAEVMVGTRLTAKYKAGGQSSSNPQFHYVGIEKCGTEIVTGVYVCDNAAVGSTAKIETVEYTATPSVGQLVNHAKIVTFDWAPKVYMLSASFGGLLPIGDFETYRVITANELAKLHDTATLYMFGVPLIDSYNK